MTRSCHSHYSKLLVSVITTSYLLFTNLAQAELSFLNGGIGQEEAVEMRAKAGLYNLQMYFYEGKTGHSITGVKVNIIDKKINANIFSNQDAGPMMFITLDNGKYEVIAEYDGIQITKQLNISTKKSQPVFFNWDINRQDDYQAESY